MDKKKELKEEYKNMKFPMGVFQIRNTVNGKIFVDSGINMQAKWNRNKSQLKFGNHPNKRLQKDWNEFGEEAFIFEILSELEQKDTKTIDYQKEVKLLEEIVMDEIQPFDDKGYNKRPK